MTSKVCSTITRLDGLALFIVTAGENRLPLLILHGFASSAIAWAPVVGALATDRYVLAYDRPGFGLTRVSQHWWRDFDPYAPSAQVPIALALLDKLGIDRVVVLGHSLGGQLATELARTAPDRVAGLIIIAPAWERPSAPRIAQFLRTRPVSVLGRSLVRTLTPLTLRIARRATWAGLSAASGQALVPLTASIAGWDEELWRVTTATLLEPKADLPQWAPSQPTLVVLGEHDRIVSNTRTLELVEQWRKQGSSVRLERFERSGHFPHVEEFERLIGVIR
ncbi:MAG: alpha/beta fold hydrolase, partial [Thermomicrobium sp.]